MLMIFDRPFMLYLEKRDAGYHYPAIWIENTDLLIEKGCCRLAVYAGRT